jgi:hypothetical protein
VLLAGGGSRSTKDTMKKTKLQVSQYLLCGFLGLIINWLMPGFFMIFDIQLNHLREYGFFVFFIAYPLLFFIWRLLVTKQNKGEGASWWWFLVGYLISLVPIIFLFLAFFVARLGSRF